MEEFRGPIQAEITPPEWSASSTGAATWPRTRAVSPAQGSTSTNYNGPVFHGSVGGAPLAWSNQTVTQTRNDTQQVAQGFEVIAEAVADTLRQLPAIGLPEEDQQDAEAVANEVLTAVVQDEPNQKLSTCGDDPTWLPGAGGGRSGPGRRRSTQNGQKASEHLGSSF